MGEKLTYSAPWGIFEANSGCNSYKKSGKIGVELNSLMNSGSLCNNTSGAPNNSYLQKRTENYINMLTEEQEKWIAHLSDKNKISIIPLDPTAEEKFKRVKQRIQEALGKGLPVEHHGATSLGISGQDEIDIYIPVPSTEFNSRTRHLSNIFGEPKSLYLLQRARFVTEEDGKHIDIFLINEEHSDWGNLIKFESYLRSHPKALEDYRILKENGDELSVREYYRRKTEFVNEILDKAGDS